MVDRPDGGAAGQALDALMGVHNIHYRLEVSGFDGPWRVQSMHFLDGVGGVPACKVHALLSPNTLGDETELFGKDAHLTVERDQEQRSFKGICRQAKVDHGRDAQGVTLTIVPAAWTLSQGSDSRIYQDLSVPELVDKVFQEFLDPQERKVRSELAQTYEAHEYLVQHRESHYHFLARLLHEEGIWFYFDHESEDHEVLVLCDTNDNRPRLTHPDDGTIQYTELENGRRDEVAHDLHRDRSMGVTDTVSSGHDWTRPDLSVHSAQTDRAEWGGPAMENHDHDRALRYHGYDDGGGAYGSNTAQRRSQHQTERLDLARSVWVVQTTATDARPGHVFELEGADEHDGTYLILSVSAHGSQNEHGGTYGNTLRLVPTTMPYRPPMPERRLMPGPETAFVVGPAGEEIHTDRHGRIKVHFHWDRRGQRNEHSTAWIRVVQAWAGKGWGSIFIPRIGMEVLVTFLGGDPNRPLVHGCLYNGSHAVPYQLPAHKTRSTIKTNSSLGGEGYNELRFEDKKGQEEVWIHAEKDFNELVENNHDTHVKNCQTNTVDVDQTQTVKRDQEETVERDQSMTVERNRTKVVLGDEMTEIGPDSGNRTEKVHNDEKVEILGERVHEITKDDTLLVSTGTRRTQVVTGDHITQVTTGKHDTQCLGRFYVGQLGDTEQLLLDGRGDWKSETGILLHVPGQAGISLSARGTIVIDATQEVAIRVGSSTSIVLSPEGIEISGPKITINSESDVDVNAAGQINLKR